ncbi:MAG: sigma-70 family RNA polymerase sigma factor, partial [Dorea sp.]|nr:sigma-70 family RNA polymerase sigma factor [Dorea sp.]
REYQKYYGCEPSENVLCALLDVEWEKLQEIKKSTVMGQIDSLSRPMLGQNDDITWADAVAADENIEEDVIKRLDAVAMKERLWIAVDQLPEEQSDVIRKRYKQRMTVKEVGDSLAISPGAVRNIEEKAIRLLRSPRRCRTFRAYYEEYIESYSFRHVGVRSFQNTWMSEVEREVLGW